MPDVIKYVLPVYCCINVIHKIMILYWLNYLSIKKLASLVVMKLDILNYGNKVVLTGYFTYVLFICTFRNYMTSPNKQSLLRIWTFRAWFCWHFTIAFRYRWKSWAWASGVLGIMVRSGGFNNLKMGYLQTGPYLLWLCYFLYNTCFVSLL